MNMWKRFKNWLKSMWEKEDLKILMEIWERDEKIYEERDEIKNIDDNIWEDMIFKNINEKVYEEYMRIWWEWDLMKM